MIKERAAVLTRFASSFLRFGHFELHHLRSERELLRQLITHAVEVEFPELGGLPWDAQIEGILEGAIDRQAFLVAHWLRVGYVEGNMNSDNTSLSGGTLDLGPFSFMERCVRSERNERGASEASVKKG
jgi:uncharacterized protein YdiU (UPF0061 family)